MHMRKRKEKQKSIWYTITHISRLDKKEYVRLVRRIMLFIIIGFVASFLVFFGIAWFGGISKVLDIIATANLYVYALAFLSVFAGYLLRFVKWNYYLKKLGLKVPLKKNLIVYLSLYSMNITPGKVGRVLVAYTLNRVTKKKTTNLLPVVMLDIFTDFIGVGTLALIAAIYFHTYVLYIIAIDIVLMIPFLFLVSDWFYNIVKRLIRSEHVLKLFTLYGDEYFASQSTLNKPRVYAVSLAVSLPAAFLNAMALYFALIAIGFAPHIAGSAFIESSSMILGMVTAVPGNIGVTDGALVAFIGSAFHASSAISSAVTIMTRLATLWFGVILGGVLLIYSMRYWNTGAHRRKRHAA
ncbi:MAG: flippase-like domain-containing protein [Candidatus Marsarchaeota archaeon]|nr:flippase-like domain-containing protein [Candidatus Marsarchaeota archaeon]MCL5418698.1 flippase-like domain-containing protein [Candidatus Marsarchaeota archaeon]